MAQEIEDKSTSAADSVKQRRPGRSLFGPILLIAIGVYFLLANLGYSLELDWVAGLSWWPLLLIFVGINIIVRQAPRPLGTILSGLVAVVAIATFAYIMLTGQNAGGTVWAGETDLVREQKALSADGLDSAEVNLDLSVYPVTVSALTDSGNLIEADVAYRGELIWDVEKADDRATVSLDTTATNVNPFFWLNPANWGVLPDDEATWDIGLNRRVPLALLIDVGTGSAELGLEELDLTSLELDGGAGRVQLSLPAGEYETDLGVGAGSAEVTLPSSGSVVLNVDGGAGSLAFLLPDAMEARIDVVDGGAGSFNPGARLDRSESGDGDEGVWETEGYREAADRVTIYVDIGAGSVSVR